MIRDMEAVGRPVAVHDPHAVTQPSTAVVPPSPTRTLNPPPLPGLPVPPPAAPPTRGGALSESLALAPLVALVGAAGWGGYRALAGDGPFDWRASSGVMVMASAVAWAVLIAARLAERPNGPRRGVLVGLGLRSACSPPGWTGTRCRQW